MEFAPGGRFLVISVASDRSRVMPGEASTREYKRPNDFNASYPEPPNGSTSYSRCCIGVRNK
ncbi:hypothetical protein KSX_41850 [Ktedonospora formicarum]|uniref:Uncharacterized protein n=1 Tax=Ktedonospora formicarum TaxID=2778364 RepID=A0A8J3HXK2_9CHLR|nr:hypothetical protein KSX_41850 [Ktedonospora formicarum]